MAHSVFQKWLDTVSKTWNMGVFECRRPPDSKNGSFFVKNVLAHNSAYSCIHPPARITQHHTTHHNTTHNTTHHRAQHCTQHTTHSAPATHYNMSEARHHYPEQDQAHFIQSGARSENWPRPMHSGGALRCRCVAGCCCCCSCLLDARCRFVSLSVGVGVGVGGVVLLYCVWC